MSNTLTMTDAGHGKHDPGAVGPTGLKEKDVALAVTKSVNTTLRDRYGLKVGTTREGDTFLEPIERARLANRRGAKLFVSIHLNSATSPAEGIETWIARGSKVSLEPAEFIQDALVAEFPDIPDRGIKRGGFTVLTKTKMAAVLVEIGFLHTLVGEKRLRDPDVQRRTALAIAQGIAAYYGLDEVAVPVDPEEPEACVCEDTLVDSRDVRDLGLIDESARNGIVEMTKIMKTVEAMKTR